MDSVLVDVVVGLDPRAAVSKAPSARRRETSSLDVQPQLGVTRTVTPDTWTHGATLARTVYI